MHRTWSSSEPALQVPHAQIRPVSHAECPAVLVVQVITLCSCSCWLPALASHKDEHHVGGCAPWPCSGPHVLSALLSFVVTCETKSICMWQCRRYAEGECCTYRSQLGRCLRMFVEHLECFSDDTSSCRCVSALHLLDPHRKDMADAESCM